MATVLNSVLAPEMTAYAEMLYGADRDTEDYFTVFKSLDKFMVKADVKTKELPEPLVLDWLNSLNVVRRTKNGYISRMRKFARYLMAMGIPAYEPDYCRENHSFVEYTFSDEEFSAIIEIADNATANAFKSPTEYIFPVLLRVLYGCGLRIQETLVLQWRDVNLDAAVITILEAKNNKQRFVPMSASLCAILKQYKKRRFPVDCEAEYLFGNPGKSGMPYIKSTFRYWFQRVISYANISNERKTASMPSSRRCLTMRSSHDAALFSRYISEFLYDYAPNFLTHSECTLKSYKDALTLYVMFLEEEGIIPSAFSKTCFEKRFIEKWIRWLKDKRGCVPDTCNIRLASIRVFLKFVGGRDVGLLYLYQDAKTIKRQKCVRKKVCGLTRAAVTAMLSSPDPSTGIGKRDLVFMILLYATAGRLGEILSIKIGQLHLDGQKPYVTIIGKGEKTRTLYLLPRAVAHLEKYIRDVHGNPADPEAYLFYSSVGGKYAMMTEPAIDKRLKKYAEDAHERCSDVPLNIHAHQFRHAKASHWIEDGLNVLQVSFLLGHANLETTMVYLDITTEEKAKALATLENENDKKISKKWKNPDGSLMGFCGLNR